MTRLLVGAYTGNDPGSVDRFAAWMGSPPDLASVHGGEGNEQDANSIDWPIWSQLWNGPKCVSFPSLWNGVTLADAAAGRLDAAWHETARKMWDNESIRGDQGHVRMDKVYVRFDWEQNGGWMKWAANSPDAYPLFISAWRRLIPIVRSYDTDNRLRVIWCPNIGQDSPENTFPGADMVNVHSIDFYWRPIYGEPSSGADAFTFMRTRQWGLDWQVDFAKKHGLDLAVSEFGITTDNGPDYFRDAFAFFQANGYVFVNYWDSNGGDVCKLSPDVPGGQLQFPRSAAAYRAIVRAIQGAADAVAVPPTPPAPPAPATGTQGMITLYFSGDQYNGAPVADISLDGGPTQSVPVTAVRGLATQTVEVAASPGVHVLSVGFNNDAWGGPGLDRNLYLERVEGVAEAGVSADFLPNLTRTFNVTVPAAPAAPASTSGVDYSAALAAILAEMKAMHAEIVQAVRIGAVSSH